MYPRDERSGNQDLRPWYIYVLYDPRKPDLIRYVGWTTNPKRRLAAHLREARVNKTYCQCWKQSLLKVGIVPVMLILESGFGSTYKDAEVRWISHYRSLGAKLTNLTDGGDGTKGRTNSPEHRAIISAYRKGRSASPETRLAQRLAHLGKPLEPERVAKIAAANRGRKQSKEERDKRRGKKMPPEGVAKSVSARRGQKRSPEFSKKMSLALRGRKLSTQHILNMEASRQGRKHSTRTKKSISESIKEWHAKRRLQDVAKSTLPS